MEVNLHWVKGKKSKEQEERMEERKHANAIKPTKMNKKFGGNSPKHMRSFSSAKSWLSH